MSFDKILLRAGQILLGIQWVKMTVTMSLFFLMDQKGLVLFLINEYYLVMIGLMICTGFLSLNKKEEKLK